MLIRMRDNVFKALRMCYYANFMTVQPSLPYAFSKALFLPLVPLILSQTKTAKSMPSPKSRRKALEDNVSLSYS